MLITQPYSWNMFYFILLLFFSLDLAASDCVCGQGEPPDFMSSNVDKPTGDNAVYPWLVRVEGPFNKNNLLGKCSGALLNQKYVALDESCFDYDQTVSVTFPYSRETRSGKVLKTRQDYALIELESSINTTSRMQPACIASPESINLNENMDAIATYVDENDATHRALMKIVPNDDSRCKKGNFGKVLQSDKLCAIIANNGTFCPKLTGIPLVMHINGSWFLIGISYYHKDCTRNVGSIFINFKNTFGNLKKDISVDGGKCTSAPPLSVTSTTEDEIITSTTATSSLGCDFTCLFDAYLPEFRNKTFTIDCMHGSCNFRNQTEELCDVIDLFGQRILVDETTTTPSG